MITPEPLTDEQVKRLRRMLAAGPLDEFDWKFIEFWNWLAAKAAAEKTKDSP